MPRRGCAYWDCRNVRPAPGPPQVLAAITQPHRAGIRVHVVTGDNGLTAAEIARRVGIDTAGALLVTGTRAFVPSSPRGDPGSLWNDN